MGLPRWLSSKDSSCHWFSPWVGTIPWRREWLPTPVFLPGESYRQRSLVDYSSWGRKKSTRLSNWTTTIHQWDSGNTEYPNVRNLDPFSPSKFLWQAEKGPPRKSICLSPKPVTVLPHGPSHSLLGCPACSGISAKKLLAQACPALFPTTHPVFTARLWASRRQGRKWVLKHPRSRLGAGQGADICLQEWPAPHSFHTRMISDVDAVLGFDHGWLKWLQHVALDLVPKAVNLTWHAVGCRKQPRMEPFGDAPLLQASPEGGLFYERVAWSGGWMQALLWSSRSPICWSQNLLMDPVQNVYSPRWPLFKVSRGWLHSQRGFVSSSPR